MSHDPAELQALLLAWLDDGDAEALSGACTIARRDAIDVDATLSFVRDRGDDPERIALALRRLRFAIGLPVVAGPVCRRPTGD